MRAAVWRVYHEYQDRDPGIVDMAEWVAKHRTGEGGGEEPAPLLPLTWLGNSLRFANLARERARFVEGWGWVVWDGQRWNLTRGIEVR